MADVIAPSQLGICEHCQDLLTMPSVLAISPGGTLYCPICRKVITLRSFGYRPDGAKLKKMLWVNEHGNWSTIIPEEDFKIGRWSVMIHPIHV